VNQENLTSAISITGGITWLSDIAMPFVKATVSKVSVAVSYFWVSMIGRSLGLIFSGISTQSVGKSVMLHEEGKCGVDGYPIYLPFEKLLFIFVTR
jgi:hypothetical protein